MNKTNSNWVQLLKCGGSPFGPIPHEDFEYIIWSSIVGICSSAVSAAWFIYKKIYRSGRATYEFLEGASNDNTSQATSEPIVETESATPEPANGTLINLLDWSVPFFLYSVLAIVMYRGETIPTLSFN